MFKSTRKIWIIIGIFAFLVLFSTHSFIMTSKTITNEIDYMGIQMCKLYGISDDRQFARYENLIEKHMQDVEAFLAENPSEQQIVEWSKQFTSVVEDVSGTEIADAAIVANGILYASDGTTGDITQTEDYLNAVQNGNQVVFSDVFKKKESTGKNVRIMSINPETQNGLVIKLYQEDFQEMHVAETMDKGGIYYLCDESGNALYYLSAEDKKYGMEHLNTYTTRLCSDLDSEASTSKVTATEGKDLKNLNCKIYVYHLQNGWKGIVTFPNRAVRNSLKHILTGYYVIFAGFLIIFGLIVHMDRRMKHFDEMNSQLSSEQTKGKELLFQSQHDPLTGVLNRKGYERVLQLLKNKKNPICFIMFDIDFFKSINDNYGHEMGDKVLQVFASELKNYFRSTDYIIRYGGDEFIVIMQCVSMDEKAETHSIQKKIERMNKSFQANEIAEIPQISVSAGIAFSKNGDVQNLFQNADEALYNTKENGRCGSSVWNQEIYS